MTLARHDIGDDVPLLVSITDTDGDPFDPATVTVAVTDPAGSTVATGPLLNPSVGDYQTAVGPVAVAGRWRGKWTTTGPANVEHFSFYVGVDPPARLEPLATVDDLEALLGRSLTTAEARRAPGLLRSASTRVRAFCRNRKFTPVAGDVVTLRPIGPTLRLPNTPVTAVNSVTAVGGGNGLPDVVLSGWRFDGIDLIDLGGSLDGDVFVALPALLSDLDWSAMSYRVNYDHGDELVPDIVAEIAAGAALRPLTATDEREALTQLTVGQYTEQYQQATGSPGNSTYLTKQDKEALIDAGYRRTSGTIETNAR